MAESGLFVVINIFLAICYASVLHYVKFQKKTVKNYFTILNVKVFLVLNDVFCFFQTYINQALSVTLMHPDLWKHPDL